MLVELSVADLGVIARADLILGPGLTALTGETGAGKTMLVEAISLLLGRRAEPHLVRTGADEAIVEGRFVADGEEIVLTRVIPSSGRSRAYVNGRMATAAVLAEQSAALVELHGQHTQQALLAPGTQRAALDRFAGIDLTPLVTARAAVRAIDERLAALGGDPAARAREIDLLGFQLDELDSAGLTDADEDGRLDAEEDLLADADGHRQAAALALAHLRDDGGVADSLGAAQVALAGRDPFADQHDRLAATVAELDDIASEIRRRAEGIADDPERLAAVRVRRQTLADLRRKYGTEPGRRGAATTLAAVLTFAADARARRDALERHDELAGSLDRDRAAAVSEVASAAALVGGARRHAAPELAGAISAPLADLGLPRARVEVAVGADDPGDDVRILLAANPGSPPLPLARAASGGELSRTMLALRLVLSSGPPVLVFDEVDAGIGGEAGVAVGRSLGALGADRQVLVVTHLPQVAAFADAQVRVTKSTDGTTTVADARVLTDEARVEELSRMLSGQPDSERARDHAAELLTSAAAERRR